MNNFFVRRDARLHAERKYFQHILVVLLVKNCILMAIIYTEKSWPRLTAKWKNSEHCDACRYAKHCDENWFDLSKNVSVECLNSLRHDSAIHGIVSKKAGIFINIHVRASDFEKESNALLPNKFLLSPPPLFLKWRAKEQFAQHCSFITTLSSFSHCVNRRDECCKLCTSYKHWVLTIAPHYLKTSLYCVITKCRV
jgi:hypothetical protein